MRDPRVPRRRLPMAVLLGCLASAALAQTPEARTQFPPSVRVNEDIVVYQERTVLQDACRASYEVEACTEFTVEHFDCRCERADERWFIAARIDVAVVIHTSNLRFLAHERQHIIQVEHCLPRALERFTSLPITERSTCENLARVMSAPSFAADVINKLARESNARLGCSVRKPSRRTAPMVASARKRH